MSAHPHWAATLVGRPYTEEKNCWSLVRDVFAQQHGVEMPHIEIGGTDNLRALKRAVQTSGLRRVHGRPQPGDLVVLRDVVTEHVGVVVTTNAGLSLLHAVKGAGVICERWSDAAQGMTAELWRRVPGQPGQEPDWQTVPADRDTLRSALQIAAVVAVNYFFPGSGFAAIATRTAIVIGSQLIINAVLPPTGPELRAANGPQATGNAFSTSLQGNQARLDQPIWKICGRREITPPYAAQPYYDYRPRVDAEEGEEDLDQDQYLSTLLAIGIGDHTLHSAKIGNTPISRFEDVVIADYLAPGVAPSEVEANVTTAQEVAGLVLRGLEGATLFPTAGFPACAPRRTCSRIRVDVVAPRGLGKTGDLTVKWKIQYRTINDFGQVLSAWADLGAEETRTAFTATPQRWSVYRTFATAIRPEIRVIRTDTEDTDPGALHELVWAGLGAYMAEPAPLNAETAYYEVVLRASEQLSNLASRDIRLDVEGHARSLDADLNWVAAAPTRNPAWWILDLATSTTWGMGKPDNRVDLQAFYDLAQICDERQDRFDYVFDGTVNAWDAMQLIARSCRSRVFRRNGVISVARDQLADVPVTMFSHRNCQPGIAIRETTRTRRAPDGFIIEYQDHRTWEWTEIECPCPGVTSMQNPQRKRLEGIVGATHAEREGRYYAADLLYRQRPFALTTEMLGVLPAYMSPVYVLPDIEGYGQAGDVCFWDADTLVMGLSEPADFSGGLTYLTLQRDDGSLTDPVLVTPGPTAYDVVLPAAPDFTLVLNSGLRERPKYVLGAAETCKVLDISDGGRTEDGAQLYALSGIVDDERVHTADVSLLPGPGEIQDPRGAPDEDDDDGEPISADLIPNLTDRAFDVVYSDGSGSISDPVYGEITLRNDGRLRYEYDSGSIPVQSGFVTRQWLRNQPAEVAQCALFEVRFDLVVEYDDPATAVLSGATLGTWLSLATSRTVRYEAASASSLSEVPGSIARVRARIRDAATQTQQASAIFTFGLRRQSSGG